MVVLKPSFIKNLNNRTVTNVFSDSDFTSKFEKVLNKIKERVELEIPDKGYFRNIVEDFSNHNKNIYAKSISLSVERDENIPGKALLVLSALHPKMNTEALTVLMSGDRKSILKYINDPMFKKEVEIKLGRLTDSLKSSR